MALLPHEQMQLLNEIEDILVSGDRAYLRQLSAPALLDTLLHELWFLGWWHYADSTRQAAIRRLLLPRLPDYLARIHAPVVRVDAHPWVVPCTTTSQGRAQVLGGQS